MGTLLGRPFPDGAVIARQGDPGDCMFVIQEGRVELLVDEETGPVRLAVLGPGDFFGEMGVLEKSHRRTTARALGTTRVLTVDRTTLMRRIHEDPCLAMDMLEGMARRLAALNAELVALRREPAPATSS